MKLEDIGYNNTHAQFILENNLQDMEIGRVIAEHRERYMVRTRNGDLEAEITGNLRFSARSREDFPAVGDWVTLITYDANMAIIHKILPRHSAITRQAVGQTGEVQLIAANVDYAFLVQAIDRDFSVNRLERYLTICHESFVKPIVVLTKTDLADQQQVDEITESINRRIQGIPVIALSNLTNAGYESLKGLMMKGKTYCMLGSSGVGKSTLLNNLAGKSLMKTGHISHTNSRGRHITSHRELVVLDNGSILIDNPGMREVGTASATAGLSTTFDKIAGLSANCKFANCTHTSETGCAVLNALENGEIDRQVYDNYIKLLKEQSYFESSVADRKRKEKMLGKILKDYHKKNVKGRR